MFPVFLSDVFRMSSSAWSVFRGELEMDFNITLH